MKQLLVLLFLFVCGAIYSQSKGDSILITPSIKSVIIQKVDSSQITRINNIEERLAAFYTQNRRSHTFIFVGLGVSTLGVLLSQGESDGPAMVLPFAGTVMSLIGTVIYLDSYKFLNFKPKRKVMMNSMTYY